MDSIIASQLAGLIWKALAFHVIVGALFTRTPFVSKMYVMAAYEHAKAATEVFKLSERDPAAIANGVVPLRAKMAINAVIMADKVIDYHEERKKYFVHTHWISEVFWTFGFRLQTWIFELERKRILIRMKK